MAAHQEPLVAIYSITRARSVACHQTLMNTPRIEPSEAGRYSIYLPRRDERL